MNANVMETKELPLESIKAILHENKVEDLVRVEEASFFEFREHTYNTATSNPNHYKARLELVRDITAMANSGGGLICFGLQSAKKSSEKTEYVTAVVGINRTDIYMESWQDILADMIVPRFSHDWLSYGYAKAGEQEIFWMDIKGVKQAEAYPLIVAKDQWDPEQGKNVKGLILGLYHRDGAENVLTSPENLRRYIADGLSVEKKGGVDISSRVVAIDTKLDILLARNEESQFADTVTQLVEKEKKAVEYAKGVLGSSNGFFYIHAIPKSRISIQNFWNQSSGSPYTFLKEPPYFRRMGWDLRVAESEYPVPKEDKWQIMNGDRKIITLSRSGEFFAAGSIEGFLDWGVATPNPEYRFINGFALVEFIDTFSHAFHIARTIFDLETDYEIRYGFHIPDGVSYKFFAPDTVSAPIQGLLGKPLQLTKWEYPLAQSDERFPSFVAADIVIPIYVAGFGMVGENYPYLKKQGDNRYAVDEELYKK